MEESTSKRLHTRQSYGHGNVELKKHKGHIIDEELEEDPEEEIYEDFDENAVHEDSEEDLDEEVEEEPEEDPEEELSEEPDNKELPMGNSNSSSFVGNKLNEYPEQERGMKVVNGCGSETILKSVVSEDGNSGRRRKSRWDLNSVGETLQINGTSKRRKTRWDNNDSQNGSVELSGFFNSLEILTDSKTLSLRMQMNEINKKLLSSEIQDERPADERSPSPEPEYNNLGIRINTRDARLRKKLINERNRIKSKLAKTSIIFGTPFNQKNEPAESKTARYVKKLFIPEKEYPTYNFIGLILGPKGNTQKKMEKETGAKILLRGKGSGQSEDEDLHVRVEANNQQAFDAAVVMIEKLLIPVEDQRNDHKKAQLQELAKMRGIFRDDNVCHLCKEPGHKQYACPLQDSTFKAVCCDICGSFRHLTSNCRTSEICKTVRGSAEAVLDSTYSSKKEVDYCNVYVGYLPHAIDDKRLKELFSPFGKIIKSTVIKDQTTGLSKGYGFVKFETPSDATEAVTYMNGYKMDGKMLAVRVAGLKPVPGPLNSGPVLIHSTNTALPSEISFRADHTNGPMLPDAQVSTSNISSSSYSWGNIEIGQTKTLNHPSYIVSSEPNPKMTSNYASGYGFTFPNPSSLSNPTSRFPGDPDHPGSQFQSYFTIRTVQETDTELLSKMPVTDRKPDIWSDYRFP